jgi:hypothetical protein
MNLIQLKERWNEVIGADKWLYMEACLSAVCTLFLKDNKNPLGLIIIGPSAGSKSTILNMFKYLPNNLTHHTDKFTPASFLTQATNVPQEKLESIDLIRKLPNRILLVPDLVSMFGKKEQEVKESLSILTRVMDGDGLSNDGGVQGHREFNEECVFVMLGAVVKIVPAIWRIVSEMGTRLLFIRMDRLNIHESQTDILIKQINNSKNYRDNEQQLKKMTDDLIKDKIERYGIRQGEWNKEHDEFVTRMISLISELISKLRVTEDNDIGLEQNETPYRVLSQLINLMQGRAILYDRDYIVEDDLSLALVVAMSSVDLVRGQITGVSIKKYPDYLSLKDFVYQTNFMQTKLRQELSILTQIGILETRRDGNADKWKLHEYWEDLVLI